MRLRPQGSTRPQPWAGQGRGRQTCQQAPCPCQTEDGQPQWHGGRWVTAEGVVSKARHKAHRRHHNQSMSSWLWEVAPLIIVWLIAVIRAKGVGLVMCRQLIMGCSQCRAGIQWGIVDVCCLILQLSVALGRAKECGDVAELLLKCLDTCSHPPEGPDC
jgi:hypothetical protein